MSSTAAPAPPPLDPTPAAGTPQYEAVKASVVRGLVEQREWELEGEAMGIEVTDDEIDKELDQLKQQYFQGDEQKYQDELAKQGITEQQVRADLHTRVLSKKIFDAVTKNVAVSDTDIAAYDFVHPEKPEIKGLSHILWTGAPTQPEAHARNAVFYGDKAIDRSPCGTGTSARMAQWAAKGRLKPGDAFVHESIIGSLFRGRVEAATSVGNRPAIIPSIAGWARMTGYNTIFIDDRDPYAHGFQVV